MSSSIKNTLVLLQKSYRLLRNNDPLILSSSTAFFATFSLSPIIIILVNILSLYFKQDDIRSRLFSKISSIFGEETAKEVASIVHNFRALESNVWITIGGFLFFLFVATTLLGIVRQAIHKLWRIKKKPQKRLGYNVKERLIEMSMVLFIGFL